jgi:hypothetical protein
LGEGRDFESQVVSVLFWHLRLEILLNKDKTLGSDFNIHFFLFQFLLRDILQFDETIDDSINRIVSYPRTCDLILGVGDGKVHLK